MDLLSIEELAGVLVCVQCGAALRARGNSATCT
jgi:hypothetical protein